MSPEERAQLFEDYCEIWGLIFREAALDDVLTAQELLFCALVAEFQVPCA